MKESHSPWELAQHCFPQVCEVHFRGNWQVNQCTEWGSLTLPVSGHEPIDWGPSRMTKVQGSQFLSLPHFLSSPPILGHQNSVLSSVWTPGLTPVSPGPQGFGLSLSHIFNFLVLRRSKWDWYTGISVCVVGLGLHNHVWDNSPKNPLLSPIGSVPLKNSNFMDLLLATLQRWRDF